MGFIDFLSNDVARTGDVSAGQVFVSALCMSPFFLAWLWRVWR